MKTLVRRNVCGLVFSCPAGAFRSVEAWLHAKAPSDSTVYDAPTQLLAYGLTIADAHKVDGVYYRSVVSVPSVTKIKLPSVIAKATLLDFAETKPKVFPHMVYFDVLNHRPKKIGTAGPSKISKSNKK